VKSERHEMIGFLIGPLWPAALTLERRRNPRHEMRPILSPERPARSLRAAVLIEFVVLVSMLGWLVVGLPGLACAADFARDGLHLPAGDAFARPEQTDLLGPAGAAGATRERDGLVEVEMEIEMPTEGSPPPAERSAVPETSL